MKGGLAGEKNSKIIVLEVTEKLLNILKVINYKNLKNINIWRF